MDAEPSDPAVLIGSLGALQVVALTAGPMMLEHGARTQRADTRGFCFLLQRSGKGELRQQGCRELLSCGDIALYDPANAWQYQVHERGEIILLHIPAALLAENLPDPAGLCGRRLGCNEGLIATVGAMTTTLVSQLRGGLDEVSRQRAANHLLGMISSCFVSGALDDRSGSAIVAGRLWRIRDFIEQNLRNPDLSPTLVASAMRVSPRYLRMIFATQDESIASYVRRRRLEECANQLADARWRGHSITEIAFGWGFNSAPHFTRSFRDCFGLSPRQYRQRELTPVTLAA
ncbi:helix-turn-helix domain-containing protein [Sphingomonas sp. Mn802worker]|uniref:helix-turn-helix domain-containing protein n=1 Tax=Sphingomonas sp. Mn802worker TaxID=629773 RepID=UPI00138AC4A5|nr:helix-turn-helix domain-containing protein [Sphingomonas sp. Mn802worker]